MSHHGLNSEVKNGSLSPPAVLKEEYRLPQNSSKMNFNNEQIDCICDSLQQRGDVAKLENFLQMYESEKIGKASTEAVMRARAFVAFERGRYRELYNILETREFNSKYHGQLQDMWYRAHYKEAEGVRGRALGEFFFFGFELEHDRIMNLKSE